MSEKNDFDFGSLMDGFLDTAKNITENIAQKSNEFIKDSGLQDLKDYYPFYSWPPINLFTSEDNSLIFEFGLAGFVKEDITIRFEDEYMIFSARLSNKYSTGSNIRSFKKKLKLSDIEDQKYYVPEDKFDRSNYTFEMDNGLLRIVFTSLPGKEPIYPE